MPLSDYSWADRSPHGLTSEERENPFQVIDDLFSYSHLPDLRVSHWELIHATVTGNFCKMSRRERSDMLYYWTKLQKVIEAVSIIGKQLEENYPNWKERMESFIKKAAPEAE
jgi:hypothetical protein